MAIEITVLLLGGLELVLGPVVFTELSDSLGRKEKPIPAKDIQGPFQLKAGGVTVAGAECS
eukprot:1160955-Pelagomonas_calceolata.AAC.2